MHSIKRIVTIALAGCLALCLSWSAKAQGDDALLDAAEGVYTPIPMTLWVDEGNPDADITALDLCEALAGAPFFDGDVLYYETFEDERGALYYRTVDIATMAVSQASFPQVFGEEDVLSTRPDDGCCYVLTNRAVYTFDAKLTLVRQAPLPASLHSLMDHWVEAQKEGQTVGVWSAWNVNPSGTAIIYRDMESNRLIDREDPAWKGLSGFDFMEACAALDYENNAIWICALQSDATPQRCLPFISYFGDYFTREHYGDPHFISDDRIYIENWGWEWLNSWEVWDLQGRRLYKCLLVDPDAYYGFFPPCQVEDAKGVFIHNPYMTVKDSTYYFDYETLRMERLPLLCDPPYDGEWSFIAMEGRTCTFAMPTASASKQTERIDFYRHAFDTGVVEPLPLALHGVELVNAALAPGGRIILLYGTDIWARNMRVCFSIHERYS